jgi:hypothetical protein
MEPIPPPPGLSPPLAPPPKQSNLLKWILGAVAALVLLGIGAAIGAGLNTQAAPSDSPSVPIASESPEPSDSPSPEPPADPEGRFGLASCDLNIDSSAPGGIDGQLIGATRVKNTGSVPLKANVTFAWLYGDGSKAQATNKTVNVAAGASKLVFFKKPVTTDEMDLFQSHPDYFDSTNCKTKVTIQ